MSNVAKKVLEFYREHGGERAWTQGWYAKDANDNMVSWGNLSACKWCLMGALTVVFGLQADVVQLCRELGIEDIGEFNDAPERTWKEVEARLKAAAGEP